MKQPRVSITKQDVRTAVTEQLRFLLKSAKDYDEGDHSEAKRMATALRVLLHKTPHSHSLLFQMQCTHWRFKDSANPYRPGNLVMHTGLVNIVLKTQGGSAFNAPLGNRMRVATNKTFSDWWGKDFVIISKQSNIAGNELLRVTRRQLVCWVANQDGGAHVDPELDYDYYGLRSGETHGWEVSINGVCSNMPGLMDASIRQITHEVLLTFRRKEVTLFPMGIYQMYDVVT